MKLYLSAALLTLAWFSVINAVSSVLVALGARLLSRAHAVDGPGAPLLFTLRMAPLGVSVLFTLGLFLPAHWAYEAREGSETFGAVVWGLALVALALFGISASRVLEAVRACRRLGRRRAIRRTDVPDVIEGRAVGMSLTGIFRTRVVVGSRVLQALDREELEVALAHEGAHRRAWDNVKRFAVYSSPDLLGFTAWGRWLEQRWAAEVECTADAIAAAGDASRAAALASALLKVARLTEANEAPLEVPVWSTFHERELLAFRVRRLIGSPVAASRVTAAPFGLLACALLVICGAWIAKLPQQIHAATEAAARLMP